MLIEDMSDGINHAHLMTSRYVIAPHYRNGTRILKKDVTEYWNQPLKKWYPTEEVLAFIHIGKAGGTSLDDALAGSVLTEGHCRMKCVRWTNGLNAEIDHCPRVEPFICGRHFDWTLITEAENKGHRIAPIVLLRDPIQRIVSHFYFAKTLAWTQGLRIKHQNLTEYLNDMESMMNTYSIWYDGEVGIYVHFDIYYLNMTFSLQRCKPNGYKVKTKNIVFIV